MSQQDPAKTEPTPTATPIMVDASATPATLAAVLRYFLMACAAVATALGYTKWAGEFSALLLAVGPVSMFLSALWGVWSANRSARQKIVMERHVPDSIAQVKQ